MKANNIFGTLTAKFAALAVAVGLTGVTWGAIAPTVTVSGTSVTISNEGGVETWDNASLEMTDDYQGKNFTIPAIGADLPSGTILKITSVSFAVSTSYTYMPDKLGLSGCTSAQKDTSGSFTGGAEATKSTYSFANTDCLVKVGTATPIRFLNSDGGKYSSYMSFRLGLNAYQFIESIVWSGKAPIIEIQAEIVDGKVGVEETTGFETGSGSGKVYVSGYKNHLKTPGVNEKELVLVDGVDEYALSINNANSLQGNDDNGNRRTIFSKVSGSGTLTRSAHSNVLNPVVEIYDSSEFTGTITTGGDNTTKMNVYFGAQDETFDDPRYLYNLLMVNNPASICVSADRSTANNNVVTIPEGKTWTASKLLNFGEMVVNGTFAGDVVNSGILTVNGTVNGTIVLDSADAQLIVAEGATVSVPTTTVADRVIKATTSGSSTVYTVVDPYASLGTKVADGFYQNGTTYGNSTDFYITSKAGLIYFRDIVNGVADVCAEYVSNGFSGTSTALQLFQGNIFQGKTVHLLSDIDLSGEQWMAIGYQDVDNKGLKNLVFYGTFDAGIYDGNGELTGTHKISNLDVAESYTTDGPSLKRTYTGLFGRLAGGTATGVKNLTIENVTVSGRQYVGAVAGRIYNAGAVIENCQVIGTININGSSAWVGGLVGECRGSIKDSSVSATGTISGLYDVGGLAGGLYQYNTGAGKEVEISNSAVSNVTVSAGYAYGLGGLVGVAGLAGDGYTSNVTISENNANNVTVTTDDTNYAGDGVVGVLVGYANENKAYAVLEDNTITGTTSANENGTVITSQIGADNDNTSIVGKEITFDDSGKVTAGIFENIPESAIASGYAASEPDAQGHYTVAVDPTVAKIGETKYETLAAALADVGESAPLTWVKDSAWDSATPVYYNGTFYATLTAAINAANEANASTAALIYVKPSYSAGGKPFVADHDNIKTSITIYGNNASIGCSWEPTIEYDGASYHTLTKNVTFALYNLHDGAGAWGYRTSTYTSTVIMCNCTNAHEVLLNGPVNANSGNNIWNIKNCTFTKSDDSTTYGSAPTVGSMYPVTLNMEGCSFTDFNNNYTVNMNNKCGGTTSATITDCTFDNCGTSSKGAVRLNGVDANATVTGALTNLTFQNSNNLCDIQIGAASASDNNAAVTYSVSGTTATMKVYETGSDTLKNDGETSIVAANDYSGDNVPPPVAQIGQTGYPTLAAALTAAQNGNTVTLVADATLPTQFAFNAGKNITLDLAGHAVTSTADDLLAVSSGTLTIEDSVGGGSIFTDNWTVFCVSGGNVVVNGGKFSATQHNTVYVASGSVVFNGGMVDMGVSSVDQYCGDNVNAYEGFGDNVGYTIFAEPLVGDIDPPIYETTAVGVSSTVQLSTDAFGVTLIWSSSDTSIATVDSTGLVTFTGAAGSATIYAAAQNGSYATALVAVGTATVKNMTTGTEYVMLQTAIEVASAGDTLKLLANVSLTDAVYVPDAAEIVIDLDGHDIVNTRTGVSSAQQAIYNAGTLTIKDSQDNGTTGGHVYTTNIDCTGNEAVLNYGTLTIEGGWFGDSDCNKSNANIINAGRAVTTYGTATLNGGHYTAIDNFTNGKYTYALYSNGSAASLTINAADIYGTMNGVISSSNGGLITVNDATIVFGRMDFDTYPYRLAYGYYGNIVINGGTWKTQAKVRADDSQEFCDWYKPDAITITGGKFDLQDWTDVYGIAKISGGIFNKTVPAKNLAANCICTANLDLETNVTYPYTVFKPIAQVGDVKYATFEDAIAAAEALDPVPAIIVLDTTAEVPDGWKFVTDSSVSPAVTTLVRKVYVAQIVTGSTTNKYETVEDALMAAQTAGATIEVLANSTETPAHALEVLMGGDITLTSSVPVRVEIAPTAKTSSVDTDGMAYIRSASADARCTFTVGANVTLAFPATAAGAGAMYIGYSSANAADMVINGRLELYEPYVGSLSTLTVNPSGSIKSISECLIVRWGAAVNVIGTGATWSDENPQAEFSYVELQGGVTTLKDTYAKGGAWVHIYDRNNKAPDYETKLVIDNSVLATSKINNLMAIEMDCDSQIVTPEVVNTGAINIDATGITQATKVIDYTGSGAMALADYGTVNVIDGMVYVDANDLWVKKLPVAQVISANGTTTNKYDTLSAALEAATNGTTVELLSDVDEDINPIPALQNVTLDFCGHTVTGQLKGAYNKKINGFVVKNGSIVGRNSSRWANLQIASGSKNVVVTNMTLTTVRPNVSTAGYAFYNQSGSSIPLQDVVADGRFYVGNSGSIIAIESGTYRNTVGAAHAIENNGVVAAKGGTFYYNPTTPNNLVADGYVATETTDGENVQCWVIERGPSLATIKLADGTETEYWDINEAFGAIEEGCTLTIKPGVYTLAAGTGAAGAYNLPANVTIIGAGDSVNDVRISSLNQSNPKGLILSGSGITVSNIYFKAEQNEGSALVIRGSGTVVDCVLDGMNETYHCVSDGMYQGVVNGTLHFLRCSILAERYAINVGETSGEVIIEDCTVKGWSSFGSGIKVTVLNTTFAEGTVTDPDYSSPYNDIRFYDDAFISNCTFNAQMEVNICYESKTGIKLIVDDSTYQGEGKLSSIITESATQSSAGSSDIANNHVAVGTGVRLNEDGEIVGGLFETVDDELIAEQYGTGANSDSETSATYPTAVGLIEVLELEEQPGATATEATYKVSVVVVDADGHAIGTVSTEQTVVVRIGDADVANATLAKFGVDKIIAAAFATAGDDSTSITTIELLVKKTAGEAGTESVAYEVHPEAIVTIEKPGQAATTQTIELSDDVLAANSSFTFDLDVTALGVAAEDWLKVVHVSRTPAIHPDEEMKQKAVEGAGGKVVARVTVTHFSQFTVSPLDASEMTELPVVTNTVVSANMFGALTVQAGTTTNAFVAVPFGAFEVGDANIAAADIVQAAALSAGDKMYVWNGATANGQKYEVYKVDANGAWVVEEHKVTVAADGTVTEGSESPESLKVASGAGIFIERSDTSKPIYVYGQVLTNTMASLTFEPGLTLVSAPSTNAMQAVDLNALTWPSSVNDAKGDVADEFITSVKGADFIYYRNAAGKVVRFYHFGGKWGTYERSRWSPVAIIPVGTAFWYSNAGSKDVEVSWPAGE